MAAKNDGYVPERGDGHKDGLEAKKAASAEEIALEKSEEHENALETTKTTSAGGELLENVEGHIEDPEKIEVEKEKDRKHDDDIPDSTAQLILEKLEKATEERNTIKGFVEDRINELKDYVKRVEAKTDELNTLKEDMKSMKEGMEDITKRVLHLENYESKVVEEMKKHFARIQEEETQ